MGPGDQGGPWSSTGIGGVHRFLNRVWQIVLDGGGVEPGDPEAGRLAADETTEAARAAIRSTAHRTLRDVTIDFEGFRFNVIVAKLMELSNLLYRYRGTGVVGTPEWDEAVRFLLLMLAPSAPHDTEEHWSRRLAAAGQAWSSIHADTRPDNEPGADDEATREVPVQNNGKLRDKVTVAADISAADLEALVLARPKIQAALDGRNPGNVVHAGGGRLVNIVDRG
jgi:leucyl-tRNA synthetase